ncbi:MAG: HlyD family type I secretion periplasmic adaptor subunit [Gammaproteobacteria bacterium]
MNEQVIAQPRAAATRGEDHTARNIGLVLVAVVFVGFGSWATLAPLSSAARAPGIVSVENYRRTVEHLEGGIVQSLAVQDGDRVEEGQVLVTLDDRQPRTQLEVLRGQYLIALAREARLVAQRDRLPAVEFPPDLLSAKEDSRAAEAMSVQTQTFAVRQAAHANEIALYEEQIRQLRAKVRGITAQKDGSDRLVTSYRAELEDFGELLERGYTEKSRYREMERNLAEAEARHGELVSETAATELQISETKLKILQLRKDFQREVAQEIAEVQAQLFELRERIATLQDTVERTIVRAPRSGLVINLAVNTIGAVIQPGERLMDIVPEDERLVVEARVSPVDIDRVAIGQQAEIRFAAFKTRDAPQVDGVVIKLSPDSLVDEGAEDSEPYYKARVEIAENGLADLHQAGLSLKAGMPAEVLINTGERTLLRYLMDPLSDLAARSFIED